MPSMNTVIINNLCQFFMRENQKNLTKILYFYKCYNLIIFLNVSKIPNFIFRLSFLLPIKMSCNIFL